MSLHVLGAVRAAIQVSQVASVSKSGKGPLDALVEKVQDLFEESLEALIEKVQSLFARFLALFSRPEPKIEPNPSYLHLMGRIEQSGQRIESALKLADEFREKMKARDPNFWAIESK